VRTDAGGAVTARAGQRVFVDPGLLPSTPVPFDKSREDDFDTWSRERAKFIVVGPDRAPVPELHQKQPIGYSDLEPYGEWVTIDNRPYWRPTVVVDYVPYRHGYWSYVPAYGHLWVGDYPFCHVTSRYGRWTHHGRFGWVWTFTSGWAPAHVAAVRYGNYFAWSPLDYYDRPVSYGSATWRVGDFTFTVGATSYCPADLLYYGPCDVYPYRPGVLPVVNNGNIFIWDIDIHDGDRHDRLHSSLPQRDYSPRRVIRGPDHVSDGIRSARARVASLENTIGRGSFRSVGPANSRSIRTAVGDNNRAARARSVDAAPDTRASLRTAREGASRVALASSRIAAAQGGRDTMRDGRRSVRSDSEARTLAGSDRSRAAVANEATRGVPPAASRAGVSDTSRQAARTPDSRTGRGVNGGAATSEPARTRSGATATDSRQAGRTSGAAPQVRVTGPRERGAAAGSDRTPGRTRVYGSNNRSPARSQSESRYSRSTNGTTQVQSTPGRGVSRTQGPQSTSRYSRSSAGATQPQRTQTRVYTPPSRQNQEIPNYTRPSRPSRSTASSSSGRTATRSHTAPSTTTNRSAVSRPSRTPTRQYTPPARQNRPTVSQPSRSYRSPSTVSRTETTNPNTSRYSRPSTTTRSRPSVSAPSRSNAPSRSYSSPSTGRSAPSVSAPSRSNAPSRGYSSPSTSRSAPSVSRPSSPVSRSQPSVSSPSRSSGSSRSIGAPSSASRSRATAPSRSSGSSRSISAPSRSRGARGR
jgi:hypothetical protein